MIKKKDFLKEYNIEKETLKKTGMKWEELNSIYDSYCRLEPQLKKIGKDFVNDYLYDTSGVCQKCFDSGQIG